MRTLLVLTNCPDADSAEKLANILVEARLAACVNILAPCRSIYRWQGEVQKATEVPLLIKTVEDHYVDLENTIRAHHPYEIPEIIALNIQGGLAEYLSWVRDVGSQGG